MNQLNQHKNQTRLTTMTTYKVVQYTNPRAIQNTASNHHLTFASEMQTKYGLHHFSIEDIIRRWEDYSETYCAGWIGDDPETVSEVFGVILEEVK